MKKIIVLLLIPLLISCNPRSKNIDSNILITAWQECSKASGEPTGEKFSGKAVLVWNLHPKMDYYEETSIIHIEQLGNKRLIDSRFFILGELNNHDSSNLFTRILDEADAFLCISNEYANIETCEYGSGETTLFRVIRTIPQSHIKLVRKSDNKILAEKTITAPSPPECSMYAYNTDDFPGGYLVKMSNIDIYNWFIQYKY